MTQLKDYLLQRHSQVTAAAYEKEIKEYLKYNPKASKAGYKEIINYISYLRTRYNNAKTIDRNLCSIKAYYKYLCHTEKRKDNPARAIQLRDKENKAIQLQDLFTAEELEKLLNKPALKTILSRRNKILITLLIYQGLQAKELEQLTITDVNLNKGTITIRASNTTNKRELPLRPNQIMLLNEYLKEDRPKLLNKKQSAQLLLNIAGDLCKSGDFTAYVKRRFTGMFEGRPVTITTIRQSVVRNLLKAGNDLRTVQVYAGHKCPSTTEKYKQSHVEELQAAVNKYHPFR